MASGDKTYLDSRPFDPLDWAVEPSRDAYGLERGEFWCLFVFMHVCTVFVLSVC